jgi:hypothetical protein
MLMVVVVVVVVVKIAAAKGPRRADWTGTAQNWRTFEAGGQSLGPDA